jgi:flagellar export protein FliJ
MTKAFRFHSIQVLRQRERDTAGQALEEVHRAIGLIDEQITTTRDEISGLERQRRMASQGSIAIADLMEIQRHELVLSANVQYFQQQRGKLVQEKERREHRLMKAQQAVKAIEKLHEQHQQAEAHREAQQLQIRLDEWSGAQTILKRNESQRAPANVPTETSP